MKLGTAILKILKTTFKGNFVSTGTIIETIAKSAAMDSLVYESQKESKVVLSKEDIVKHSLSRSTIIAKLRRMDMYGFITKDESSFKTASCEDKISYKITPKGLTKLDEDIFQ